MDGGSNPTPAGDITNLHYNFVVAKPLVLNQTNRKILISIFCRSLIALTFWFWFHTSLRIGDQAIHSDAQSICNNYLDQYRFQTFHGQDKFQNDVEAN